MFEMVGGKNVNRKPKNAAITSNNKNNRGVSANAPRSKQALTKSTKQKRNSRKHGGSKNKPIRSEKKESLLGTPHGVLHTEDEYQEMTERVIEIMEVKKLETPSDVAAVINDEFLKGKPRKEKADILDGFARHVGKYPGRNKFFTTIVLMAIIYAFHRYGLFRYMNTKLREISKSVFPGKPNQNTGDMTPAAYKDLEENVSKLAGDKKYDILAKLVVSNYTAAKILMKHTKSSNEDIKENAEEAVAEITNDYRDSDFHLNLAFKELYGYVD